MAHVYKSTEETTLILTQLAVHLAAYIGFSYTQPNEDNYAHKLIGPDEAVLYISLIGETKGDRINISGGFHIGKTKYGNDEYVRPENHPGEITVALSRGPDAIGHEIACRFLPKYLSALAEARTKRDANVTYQVKQQTNLSRLALAAGSYTPDAESHSVDLSIGEVYGDIEAYGDSITLKLQSLTVKQAEHVIKLLRLKPTTQQPKQSA